MGSNGTSQLHACLKHPVVSVYNPPLVLGQVMAQTSQRARKNHRAPASALDEAIASGARASSAASTRRPISHRYRSRKPGAPRFTGLGGRNYVSVPINYVSVPISGLVNDRLEGPPRLCDAAVYRLSRHVCAGRLVSKGVGRPSNKHGRSTTALRVFIKRARHPRRPKAHFGQESRLWRTWQPHRNLHRRSKHQLHEHLRNWL